jgi:hypothetical protein
MPASRWPGTLQKNVYVPGLRLTLSVLTPPWKVGVAPSTAPLDPCWIDRLWATGDVLANRNVTSPDLAVSELLVYRS